MCLLLPYYKLSVVWFDMFNCTPSDGSFSLLYAVPVNYSEKCLVRHVLTSQPTVFRSAYLSVMLKLLTVGGEW